MAVIINDFEVVVEPPPTNNAATATQPQGKQQANISSVAPNAHDIELIHRHFKQRRKRLIAD